MTVEEIQALRKLYGVVVEKLRARGGVCDNAKHFTWEPTTTEAGTPYQHIRYGPWGVADTYHADPLPGIPGTGCDPIPGKAGDKQLADLIVGLLRWFPDTFTAIDRLTEAERDRERGAMSQTLEVLKPRP